MEPQIKIVRKLGKVVALDLGDRYIGVAVSDSTRRHAFARTVFERGGSAPDDHLRLLAEIRDLEPKLVVVGLPLSLNGDEGPAAKKVLQEVEQLRSLLEVPVETIDERFSSVEVVSRRRSLEGLQGQSGERGRSKGSTRPRQKRVQKKHRIDDIAAEIFLQAFLDRSSESK